MTQDGEPASGSLFWFGEESRRVRDYARFKARERMYRLGI